jgi:hypothetical protein
MEFKFEMALKIKNKLIETRKNKDTKAELTRKMSGFEPQTF